MIQNNFPKGELTNSNNSDDDSDSDNKDTDAILKSYINMQKKRPKNSPNSTLTGFLDHNNTNSQKEES